MEERKRGDNESERKRKRERYIRDERRVRGEESGNRYSPSLAGYSKRTRRYLVCVAHLYLGMLSRIPAYLSQARHLLTYIPYSTMPVYTSGSINLNETGDEVGKGPWIWECNLLSQPSTYRHPTHLKPSDLHEEVLYTAP